ncbi:TAXI family TRAP transporter solute-binding subunit [Actinocrispum sp. NPDC049592]|uniref:TAXI family TRAP transporter solute-binding subunit n=1 Tax=Actinocrispum sp. NPDC049592 TaxID=3154835 RepID=UPI00344A7407
MSRKIAALVALVLVLAACTNPTAGLRLTIATGLPGGVYNSLGTALAKEWAAQTGIAQPTVLETNGSGENLIKLRTGQANVTICAADLATEEISNQGLHSPRALARIYDDYFHIVVRDEAPIQHLHDLAGKRVAIGAKNSGVEFIAGHLLKLPGQGFEADPPRTVNMNLVQSREALLSGQIDAFFWSGGLPTRDIAQLAQAIPLRLVDMSEVMTEIRAEYRYYSAATIPVTTYRLRNSSPVTTLVVANLLLVTDEMPAAAAKVLTQGIFESQKDLASVNTAANSIDIRSAVETQPVPLHEGALEYYRDEKA